MLYMFNFKHIREYMGKSVVVFLPLKPESVLPPPLTVMLIFTSHLWWISPEQDHNIFHCLWFRSMLWDLYPFFHMQHNMQGWYLSLVLNSPLSFEKNNQNIHLKYSHSKYKNNFNRDIFRRTATQYVLLNY